MEKIMDLNRKLILKRLLSAAITLIMTLALLPVAYHFIGSTGGGFDSYAAGKRMEIIANQTLYVQSGGENVVSIEVKNNSGTEIRGVNFADGFGSAEDYSKYANDKPYNYTDGSSKRKTTDPVYKDEKEWYRFSPYFEEDGYNAVNAVWDSDEEGYTIAAGETATLWFKVKSEDEDPGEYTEWIKLGNTHTEWFGGFLPLTIVDEVYSDEMSVKVVTYNPSTAALAHGTSNNHGAGIAYVHPGSTIDIGTIDISKNTGLSGEKYYYTKNKTTISSGGDEHGNTQNIKVNFDFDSNNTQTADEGLLSSPLAHDRTFVNNDLPPVSGNTITAKETRISYNASDFVAGTYNATLTLRTIPHNVKVNEKAGNNNGVYTWPVKITLTGRNPRIPKAPEDVTATPGNGQVELTWNAAQGAEEGMTYYVWRREGSESDSANKDNASFDWSKYSEVGSDSPDEDGRYLFVDGTAVNGKTYTYVVIGSEPLKAYPALSKSVKPLSSLQTRILAPEVSGNEEPGGNLLSWRMNGAYDGFSNNGSSLVDHFNVYRDGVLVAQVNQNAVIEDYEYESYYDEEAGAYRQKVVSTSCNWEAFVETPVTDQDYTWSVACVSKSGVEGYWSDDIQGIGCDDRTCTITGHTAVSTVDYEGELCNEISLNVSAYNGLEKVEYWRAEGDAEPDTSKAPYFSNSDSKYDVDTDFTDRNVSRGKTYTYAARVTDTYGNASDFYTFKMKVRGGTEEWFMDSYSSSDVSWKVIKGKEARLSWYADTDEENKPIGVYRVYRNGAVIQTYTAGQTDGGRFEITNNPGTDGTYVYRMDKEINGISIRGREYTFVRNTTKVNEDEFLKVPGAPTFDVRISDGKPVLRWAASDNGGRTEGYHIYRKDGGEFVNGEYLFTPNEWSSPYRKYWSNRRYISIDDPNANVLVDGGGEYYKDDFRYGELTSVNWEESYCPHEYWITAYNQAGESEPSKIVSFEFQGLDSNGNPIIPVNESKYKPGKPTIKKVWVDWEDGSNRRRDWDTGISGKVHVFWNDAASSEGNIDYWTVDFSGLSNGYSDNDLQSWEAAQYSGAKKGLSTVSPYINVSAETGTYGDYGRTANVTVKATNSAGTTSSDAASQCVYSFPRFRVNAGDGKVKLEWTDLYNDSSTTVTSWEILRKREGGSWQTVKTINKSSLDYDKDGDKYVTDSNGTKNYTWTDTAVQNGWEYEYKVVAKCADGVDRSSVVREVIPTKNSASKAPGVPQNFRAQIVNGEVLFTWDEPATGEAQYYQLMCEQSWGDSKYWTDMGSVNAPSTSYVWSPYEAETSRFFVYAYSYINGQESPESNLYADTVDKMYPNHSDIITVTVTEADIRGQATDYPGSFSLKATPGENKVDLSWNSSEGATYYELRRYRLDNEDDDFNTLTLPGSATSYSDTTALAGVRYEYRLYAGNRCGEIYDSTYATPAGKSKDQIIAEEVEALIEALPEPAAITAGNADAVNAVKERYDALTAIQKKLVDNSGKLEECVNALEQLELLEKYRETVQPVQNAIDNLKPDEITSENLAAKKTEVAGVRAEYEAISPAEAKKIVDTSNLVAAENKIRLLEKEAEDRNVVNELINDLNNLVTADQVNESNADEVITAAEALQSRINALTSDQRSIFESDARSGGLVEKLNATANQANAVLGREHDHIMQKITATKSTCARNGNIEYYKCTACGHFFRDQNGAEEISEADTILPLDASAHSWGEWKATSTALCTKGGIEERVCKNSSLHRESRSVPATGHNWDNGTVKVESTSEREGEIEYKCTVCGATRIDKVDKIPADATGVCSTGAHTWGDPEEVKKPNCTEPGEIRYTCTTCHVIKRYQTDTDPTKHVWRNADKNDGWSIEKEATCSESGSETRRCELCDMKESRVIDASGHDWDEPERKAATCSEKGYVKFTCKRCKYTYTDVIDTDPKAHSWDGGRVTRNPAVGVAGERTFTCTRCGATRTETIAPLPQPYVAPPAPTEIQDLPSVKVSKPAKGKKAITVKWKKPKKKQLKQIGGIEIQVTGPSGTITATAGKKKSSKKIKGLLPKQTYSCRVRAYNYIGGVKHVSAWSNWKTAKTK